MKGQERTGSSPNQGLDLFVGMAVGDWPVLLNEVILERFCLSVLARLLDGYTPS
jgi:hypothetical protein